MLVKEQLRTRSEVHLFSSHFTTRNDQEYVGNWRWPPSCGFRRWLRALMTDIYDHAAENFDASPLGAAPIRPMTFCHIQDSAFVYHSLLHFYERERWNSMPWCYGWVEPRKLCNLWLKNMRDSCISRSSLLWIRWLARLHCDPNGYQLLSDGVFVWKPLS